MPGRPTLARTWLVARREFVATVYTKSFIIGVILTPVLCIVLSVLPRFLDQQPKDRPPAAFALLDRGAGIAEELDRRLAESEARGSAGRRVTRVSYPELDPLPLEEARRRLDREVERERIEGYCVLSADFLATGAGATWWTRNLLSDGARSRLRAVLAEIVRDRRLARHGVAKQVLDDIQRPVGLETRSIATEGKGRGAVDPAARVVSFLLPFFFVFLLFFGIMVMGQTLLTGVIEEKQQRIIEVLVSSVTPFELMVGKILGLFGVGLALSALWLVAGLGTIHAMGHAHLLSFAGAGWLAAYFVLGFLLFATLMAGLGSMCNDLKESQNLVTPVFIALMLPLFMMEPLMRDPNGTLARTASWFPLWTPMVMMVRLAGFPRPPAWELPATLALLAATSVFALWAAGRIFRVGILMYGKPPSLAEVWRWVRTNG